MENGAGGGIRTHDVVLPNGITKAGPSTSWQLQQFGGEYRA
jgi:hypothetical protein